MKRTSYLVWLVSGTILIGSGFTIPAVSQEMDSISKELRQFSEMNAQLRSLDGKANRLADIDSSVKIVQQRLEELMYSRWEYRFVSRNRFSNLPEQAELLGREGWELVGVTEEEGFIFKRRLRSAR